MIFIGIDPGKKGGYAVVDGRRAETHPWDDDGFLRFLQAIAGRKDGAAIVLEHVGPMPGQGVASMFHFGQSFGFIQGAIRAIGLPYELVRPQKWKKEFSVTGDKNSSIEVCKKLFPGVPLLPSDRYRKDSDGMAEALLMAEYARRHMGGR